MQGTLAQAVVGAHSTKTSLGWHIDPTGTENKNAHTQPVSKGSKLGNISLVLFLIIWAKDLCDSRIKSKVGKPL